MVEDEVGGDRPRNSWVPHSGLLHLHSSFVSYFFFSFFWRALVLRIWSRGADGGNGESLSIQVVSLAKSQSMSSESSAMSSMSIAAKGSVASNLLVKPLTLSTGGSSAMSSD